MLRLRCPPPHELNAVLARQRSADITYADRGATLTGELPAGYRHDRLRVAVGSGPAAFTSARAALADWAPQRRSGITVVADGDVEVGTTVVLSAPLPVGCVVAACRVVAVVDDETAFGFAYGSLPGHPEQGEELFAVERSPDDRVWFRIVAFSRPQASVAKLAAPVARMLQQRATQRYLDAMAGAPR